MVINDEHGNEIARAPIEGGRPREPRMRPRLPFGYADAGFLSSARLVPQLLSRFSQHGEAHCIRELLDAKPIEHARAVHFDRAHADAKLERNDFARPACNQRVND